MLNGLDLIQQLEAGAEFVTAELHVHSAGHSDDVRDGTMTVEAVVDAAVGKGVQLLSVTDHNNDKQVAPSLAHGARYADLLLVIPGVEVTTANGHLLVYCDPTTPELITTLLAKIDLKGPKGGRDSHTSRSMADVIAVAHDLGAIAVAAHIDRDKTGFERLVDGYPHWKRDIILSEGLYGLEFDDPTHLGWYSPEDDGGDAAAERRAMIEQRSTRLEVGPARLAAIQNSDAHSLLEFTGNSHLTRFKMLGLSFGGFRTALIDSEARVRVAASVPPAIPKLIGMQLFGGFADGECYRFSPNLNCFIGGRGTGKSTVVQALGYAVGAHEQFASADNCADSTVVFCEDENGIRYRFERQRQGDWFVTAEDEGGNRIDAPAGEFRVEFYKQGHLGEVARDPMKNPELLQAFLDQHLDLSDARAAEEALVRELDHNSAQLKPLEAGALEIGVKQKQVVDIDKKLKAAEEGKLKAVAAAQAQVGAEKAFLGTLLGVVEEYKEGVSLDVIKRDYEQLRRAAGEFTSDAVTLAAFEAAGNAIGGLNEWLRNEERVIAAKLEEAAAEITQALGSAPARHVRWEERIAAKIESLRKEGLSGNLAQLGQLINQRKQLTLDLARLNAKNQQLRVARAKRAELIERLKSTRETLTTRRKAQLAAINAAFKKTITDYSVYLHYRSGGINGDFVRLVAEVMSGSFMQDRDIEGLCAATSPMALASLIEAADVDAIGELGEIGRKWGQEVVRRFSALQHLHRLEVTAQPPAPFIKVITKTKPRKVIPIAQLSDGQKHTILLTVAILAESNYPLIIDQPEDDLDNAFIFSSVVHTLRFIKERRQVFIVTHNANIAVLGDSEIIFAMRRDGAVGRTYERGAIDRPETKRAAQDILEGGAAAFLKRRAIYGIG
jgi:hypothetical protein